MAVVVVARKAIMAMEEGMILEEVRERKEREVQRVSRDTGAAKAAGRYKLDAWYV